MKLGSTYHSVHFAIKQRFCTGELSLALGLALSFTFVDFSGVFRLFNFAVELVTTKDFELV